MKKLSILAFCVSLALPAYSQNPVRIGSYENYPLHYTSEETIKGTAIDSLDCIMKVIDQSYSITMYPQLRGEQLFKNNELDALITYSGREQHRFGSILSDPLVYERWNLYYTAKSNPLFEKIPYPSDQITLGSVRGSSVEHWLTQKKISSDVKAKDVSQLAKMLYSGRIDAFIASEESIYTHTLATLNNQKSQFIKELVTFSPLAAHFSSNSTLINEEFISKFNSAIPDCYPTALELTYEESQKIRQRAQDIFESYLSLSQIKDSVILSNLNFPSALKKHDIDELERQWADPEHSKHKALVNSVVESPGSELLRKIKASYNGLLLEIIVMNRYGYNVLATEKTTDYFQGDENKFQRAIKRSTKDPYISHIKFDRSSRNFGVQISFPLEQANKNIGVVTFTINIGGIFAHDNFEAELSKQANNSTASNI